MRDWQSKLLYDPLKPLLLAKNEILQYFIKRDLLQQQVPPISFINNSTVIQKIVKNQQRDGSWKSTSPNQIRYPAINYSLIETWKNLRFLIEKFSLTKKFESVERAVKYIFSCQSPLGDIRGILANQYAMYYTGAIVSLLNQAGYSHDPRVSKAIEWLLSVRQEDGGWLANFLMSAKLTKKEANQLTSQDLPPYENRDSSKPSSHNWTGMIIRAFATHPEYKGHPAAIKAGILLKSAFFSKDSNYHSYEDADNWIRFDFPYWWNNLIAAMDSLSKLGFTATDPDMQKGLEWIYSHQEKSGLWKISYSQKHKSVESAKSKENQLWISFQICRILKYILSDMAE